MKHNDSVLRTEVAERLLVTRIALDRQQYEIAADLEISRGRWFNYESGQREFDIEIAIRLCTTHKVTLEWLFRGIKSTLSPKIARKITAAEHSERS